MPYTHGPQFVISGQGTATIPAPVGLRLFWSGNSPAARTQFGSPVRWWGIGRIDVGNADGWLMDVPLRYLEHLVYPLPDGMTVLGWTLAQGITVTVTELLGVPAPTVRDMPWDRAATPVVQAAGNSYGSPLTQLTQWTYTVPSGKKLWVSHARTLVFRQTAPSSTGWASGSIRLPSGYVTQASMFSPTVGNFQDDHLSAGPLILNAGDQLVAYASDGDAGGSCWIQNEMSGFLFDA